jgi:hypothetical protein
MRLSKVLAKCVLDEGLDCNELIRASKSYRINLISTIYCVPTVMILLLLEWFAILSCNCLSCNTTDLPSELWNSYSPTLLNFFMKLICGINNIGAIAQSFAIGTTRLTQYKIRQSTTLPIGWPFITFRFSFQHLLYLVQVLFTRHQTSGSPLSSIRFYSFTDIRSSQFGLYNR